MILNIENDKMEKLTVDTDRMFNTIDKYNLDIKKVLNNLNVRYFSVNNIQVNDNKGGSFFVQIENDKYPLDLDTTLYLIYRYQNETDIYFSLDELYELIQEFTNIYFDNLDSVDLFIDGYFYAIDDLESYILETLPEDIREFVNDNSRFIEFDYTSYMEEYLMNYSDNYYYSDYYNLYMYVSL